MMTKTCLKAEVILNIILASFNFIHFTQILLFFYMFSICHPETRLVLSHFYENTHFFQNDISHFIDSLLKTFPHCYIIKWQERYLFC